MTIVVDASVVVAALTDSGGEGSWAEAIIAADSIAAPELLMVECSNILRRLEISGTLPEIAARLAFNDLLRLDVQLFPFEPFAERVWSLRKNLTGYDAWYVALAESLGSPLATRDSKLSRASGVLCGFKTP